MKRSIYVFTVIPFIFSACAPTIYGPYYKAGYDDNSTVERKAYEHGQAGPYSDIEFNIPEDISVKVQARKKYKNDEYQYSIDFAIPNRVTVQFITDDIIVTQGDGSTLPAPATMYMFASKASEVDAKFAFSTFCPISKKLSDITGDSTKMNVRTTLDIPYSYPPEQLTIQLPDILFNGSKHTVSPVNLKGYPDIKSTFYLTNAMQDRRLSRYKECMQKTPERRCKNLLEVYNNSFIQAGDDLNISGRVSWHPWNKNLRMILDIDTSALNIWQFSENEFRFEDSVNHTSVQGKPQSVSVDCSNYYALPLSTRIDNKISTFLRLNIRGSFRSNSSSEINIQLPEMRINGVVYNFKPIHLKLHRIGGGIDPIL